MQVTGGLTEIGVQIVSESNSRVLSTSSNILRKCMCGVLIIFSCAH